MENTKDIDAIRNELTNYLLQSYLSLGRADDIKTINDIALKEMQKYDNNTLRELYYTYQANQVVK